jgi:hypothetical protein
MIKTREELLQKWDELSNRYESLSKNIQDAIKGKEVSIIGKFNLENNIEELQILSEMYSIAWVLNSDELQGTAKNIKEGVKEQILILVRNSNLQK